MGEKMQVYLILSEQSTQEKTSKFVKIPRETFPPVPFELQTPAAAVCQLNFIFFMCFYKDSGYSHRPVIKSPEVMYCFTSGNSFSITMIALYATNIT